jgi:aspartate kinase
MANRIIVKFGGADLATAERVKEAAKMVIESDAQEKLVVVSAMGETTDQLDQTMTQIGYTPEDYAEIISMGERTSARVFCSALKALGANATYLDPHFESFPIATNSDFLNAQPNLEKTKQLVQDNLVPLLGETIPVICGFLGRDPEGRTTTLGRGGSDTTAMLLAACLEADEIILVKDNNGICSADPTIVPNARRLENLDIHEMFALSHGGAIVVKTEALRYKLPEQKLVIVDFSSKNLANVATEIIGDFNLNETEIKKISDLSAITIIGEITPQTLSRFFSLLESEIFYGISTGKKSLTIFGEFNNQQEIMNKLHNPGYFKAISYKDQISLIEVLHPCFIETPGWVAKITSILASVNINLIEVTTGKATINLFINKDDLDEAYSTVRSVFNA